MLGREGSVAIETKGKTNLQRRDLNGIRAYRDEHRPSRAIVVCNELAPRRTQDGVSILPLREFLERLWSDRVF